MILLDTNVVSELRKIALGRADPRVASWDRQQKADQLFLSVMSLYEIEKAILLLERREPKQSAVLRNWLDGTLIPAFAGRIIAVDVTVAAMAARLQIPDPRPTSDSLFAATAIIHGLTIATRNTADFSGLPVALFNPWLA